MELVTIVTMYRFGNFNPLTLSGCDSSIEQFDCFIDERIVLE
jgi:hypothetical protein